MSSFEFHISVPVQNSLKSADLPDEPPAADNIVPICHILFPPPKCHRRKKRKRRMYYRPRAPPKIYQARLAITLVPDHQPKY
jgi:hypothetical protein